MKKITIEIKDSKYKFILELLRSFNFVSVKKSEGLSNEKEAVLRNIVRGMQEAILAGNGKINSRPAREFLNEL